MSTQTYIRIVVVVVTLLMAFVIILGAFLAFKDGLMYSNEDGFAILSIENAYVVGVVIGIAVTALASEFVNLCRKYLNM